MWAGGRVTSCLPLAGGLCFAAYSHHMNFENNSEHERLKLDHVDLAGQSLERVSITDSTLSAVNLGSILATSLYLRDVTLESCDLSNARLHEASLLRVMFRNCRLTGLQLTESTVEASRFSGCKLDFSQFRFANIKGARYEDCDLREADFLGATLRKVQFGGCALDLAEFFKVQGKDMDFRSSSVGALRFGVGDLRGATFSAAQLVTLAPLLASMADFRIEG